MDYKIDKSEATLRTCYSIKTTRGSDIKELCKWCILHKSEGKFYVDIDHWYLELESDGYLTWYFELEADALLFALKWAN